MRIPLVSAFLPDVTQQIHSLRASGVISSHTVRAADVEIMAFRKSSGILCATPPAILFLVIRLFYQIFPTKGKTSALADVHPTYLPSCR